MPRLTPLPYQDLVRVFIKVGFIVSRQEGSHIVLSRPKTDRPIVIPKYKEVGVSIIKSCLRTAGMGRDEFFRLLGD